MEHLFHVHPLGSLVEETQETGHELKRAVGPGGLIGLGVGIILCIYLSFACRGRHTSGSSYGLPLAS
jgi:hypothetical protein